MRERKWRRLWRSIGALLAARGSWIRLRRNLVDRRFCGGGCWAWCGCLDWIRREFRGAWSVLGLQQLAISICQTYINTILPCRSISHISFGSLHLIPRSSLHISLSSTWESTLPHPRLRMITRISSPRRLRSGSIAPRWGLIRHRQMDGLSAESIRGMEAMRVKMMN